MTWCCGAVVVLWSTADVGCCPGRGCGQLAPKTGGWVAPGSILAGPTLPTHNTLFIMNVVVRVVDRIRDDNNGRIFLSHWPSNDSFYLNIFTSLYRAGNE